MHPRNPYYRTPPDFLALANAYPALKPYVIQLSQGATVNFKDELAQRRLTEAILHRDFGLKMDLPPERLCPPVPNRLNYILWLQDVLEAMALALPPANTPRLTHGLDIGTGATAIYPLLGCATHPNWRFTATEIDMLSIEYARTNVQHNGLGDRISIAQATPGSPILFPLFNSEVRYDFTMCNPPFYTSREEVERSAEAKEFGPNAVCTGADVEMITAGGEATFVGTMVEESLRLRDRCRWFTSMLGKMSSLHRVVQLLKTHNVSNYAITELVQGQTKRWVIAWSFGTIRLPDSIGRLSLPALQVIMPPRNTLHQRLAGATSVAQLQPVVMSILAAVEGVSVEEHGEHPLDLVVSAAGNTWSRAARRKKREAMDIEAVQAEAALVCRIRGDVAGQEVVLTFDWVAGDDRGLFESFASHVERKTASALQNDL